VHTALLASSERDIVRALIERGVAALDERLDQTMTRSVITCNGAMTVSEIIG
jgi:CBS domain-containing protein